VLSERLNEKMWPFLETTKVRGGGGGNWGRGRWHWVKEKIGNVEGAQCLTSDLKREKEIGTKTQRVGGPELVRRPTTKQKRSKWGRMSEKGWSRGRRGRAQPVQKAVDQRGKLPPEGGGGGPKKGKKR